MAAGERLKSPERREVILAASMELFAEHGLHGVTTRMIADAAGVSEALLYRHFRSKDDIFVALQAGCIQASLGQAERIASLEPSTSTLVLGVYFTASQILTPPDGDRRGACVKRLILSSLVGDGAFARGFLAAGFARFIPKFVASLEAAWKSGDLAEKPRKPHAQIWFIHHLPVTIGSYLLPEDPVVNYGLTRDELVVEATRFALRGLGITDAAIRQYFNPKALALFTRSLSQAPS